MSKIIIFSGDPVSINSEIIFKSWKKIKKSLRKRIYLLTNYNLIDAQLKKLKYKLNLKKVKNINELSSENSLKILNIDLKFQNPFKINTNESSKFVIKSLNTGHKLALQRNVKGFINFPINKKLLKKNNIGVTEFLAKKCKIKDNSEVMLISNNNLKVSPLTTHIDIKKVSRKINSKLIINKVKK